MTVGSKQPGFHNKLKIVSEENTVKVKQTEASTVGQKYWGKLDKTIFVAV